MNVTVLKEARCPMPYIRRPVLIMLMGAGIKDQLRLGNYPLSRISGIVDHNPCPRCWYGVLVYTVRKVDSHLFGVI